MKTNRSLLFSALLLMGILIGSTAYARDYYGALVYNHRTGVSTYVINAYSSYEAERRARRNCRARHRYFRGQRFYDRHYCRVVVRFRNTCAAYATSDRYRYGRYTYGWGYAPRQQWARRRAIQNCYNKGGRYCKVRVWACTSGRSYRRY